MTSTAKSRALWATLFLMWITIIALCCRAQGQDFGPPAPGCHCSQEGITLSTAQLSALILGVLGFVFTSGKTAARKIKSLTKDAAEPAAQ